MITAFIALVKSLSWQTYLCLALGVAGAAIYAEKTVRIDLLVHQNAGLTAKVNGLQASIDAAQELGKKTDAANRAREQQDATDQKEIADEAQRMSIRARDDSSAASTALAGLLRRATAAARGSQGASDPAIAGGGTSAEGTGLRTDLLGGVGAEAIRYGAIADTARIGRAKCEAGYDTVAQPIESERGDDDK